MTGFGVAVRVIGVAGTPRRRVALVSQPSTNTPTRRRDVVTICPEPLFVRARSAAEMPPASVMPAT